MIFLTDEDVRQAISVGERTVRLEAVKVEMQLLEKAENKNVHGQEKIEKCQDEMIRLVGEIKLLWEIYEKRAVDAEKVFEVAVAECNEGFYRETVFLKPLKKASR